MPILYILWIFGIYKCTLPTTEHFQLLDNTKCVRMFVNFNYNEIYVLYNYIFVWEKLFFRKRKHGQKHNYWHQWIDTYCYVIFLIIISHVHNTTLCEFKRFMKCRDKLKFNKIISFYIGTYIYYIVFTYIFILLLLVTSYLFISIVYAYMDAYCNNITHTHIHNI